MSEATGTETARLPFTVDLLGLNRDRMEGERQCRLGHHAWVPWLDLSPDGSRTSFVTWCAREGCNHSEQYDR